MKEINKVSWLITAASLDIFHTILKKNEGND